MWSGSANTVDRAGHHNKNSAGIWNTGELGGETGNWAGNRGTGELGGELGNWAGNRETGELGDAEQIRRWTSSFQERKDVNELILPAET